MKALKFPSETWVCMFGKEIWSALKYRYIASRCVQTTSSVDKEICWGNRVSNPSVCIRARKEWKQRWMLILELLFVFFHTLYIFSQIWVYLVVSVTIHVQWHRVSGAEQMFSIRSLREASCRLVWWIVDWQQSREHHKVEKNLIKIHISMVR